LLTVRHWPSVTVQNLNPACGTTGLPTTAVKNIDAGILEGKHEATARFRLECLNAFGLDCCHRSSPLHHIRVDINCYRVWLP
jgi:hypothetical protein